MPQRHLPRFVVEVVDGLDLSEVVKNYCRSESAAYHPAMLLSMLVYGYATKVFSSRALERATYDSVAFRFIAGNEYPDHDTIAAFRKRFLGQVEAVFTEVLQAARTMGMLKLGTVALDGTKVHANASRHSALSFGHGAARVAFGGHCAGEGLTRLILTQIRSCMLHRGELSQEPGDS